VISCGTWTGDGNYADVVNLGYEPQLVIFKRSSGVAQWTINDNMRGMTTFGGQIAQLYPNLADAEGSGTGGCHPTSTGFIAQGIAPAGETYIYIAIRRGPMKVPTDATKVFTPVTSVSSTTNISVSTTNLVDMLWNRTVTSTAGDSETLVFDRVRGVGSLNSRSLRTTRTAAEQAPTGLGIGIDQNKGFIENWYFNQAFESRLITHLAFSRAPSVMDVVCYTGTGAARTVAHNLGVAPELMIVKARTGAYFWAVWSSAFPITQRLQLESNSALGTQDLFNSTVPTSTVFSLSAAAGVSAVNQNPSSGSIDYVAYLFATCAGVSKVFSYTGNGSSQTINCGFTGGARFILIKRTDSTGDWYVWNTNRGIVAGNDPYQSLNTTNAEITSDDSVDPDSTGFVVNQVAATNVNVSSATYIGLAIA
jgi:hypothetical protein